MSVHFLDIGFGDVWREHQFYSFILFTCLVGWWVGTRWTTLLALNFIWASFSAIYMFNGPGNPWGNLQPRIDESAAVAWAMLIGLVLYVSLIPYKDLKKHLLAIEIIVIIDCAIVAYAKWGIFNSHTMDTTVIAMLIPSLWYRQEYRLNFSGETLLSKFWAGAKFILPIIAIARVGGSTFFLGVFAGGVAYMGAKGTLKKSWWWYVPVIIAIGYISEGGDLLKGGTRLTEWARFFEWWSVWAEWGVGTGTGSYLWLGPMIELHDKQTQFLLFMHNEYLQILFEQGFLGLGLALCLGADLMKRSFKTPWLFATVVTTAAVCLTYYPMRWGVSIYFMAIIARLCLEEDGGIDWDEFMKKFEIEDATKPN